MVRMRECQEDGASNRLMEEERRRVEERMRGGMRVIGARFQVGRGGGEGVLRMGAWVERKVGRVLWRRWRR